MSLSLRTVAFGTVAIGTTLAAIGFLSPYFAEAPLTLAMPSVVIAIAVVVAALEGPTRKRTRALLERDATLQVATWDYSAAAWPAVVRAAPSPGRGVTLVLTLLSAFMVTTFAGVFAEDVRALWLGAAWAVAFASGMETWMSYRDAALRHHPERRLRLTRNLVLLGHRIFVLNPEPALPELGSGVHLHHCVANPPAAGDDLFAGTLTFTSVAFGRHSRFRREFSFFIPAERAHEVDRIVATYNDHAAANRANPALALPS